MGLPGEFLEGSHWEMQALNENGVFFKKFEWQVFEKAFLHEGTINWYAFIALLRESLNATRGETLQRVWQSLDSTQTGRIHYTVLSTPSAIQARSSMPLISRNSN